MLHNAAFTHVALEQHGVETNKHIVADGAGAVDDGAMRNRRTLANGDRGARLGVDDHTILNVRIRTDADGLHVAVFIDFVRSDHCIGSDENISVYDNPATENGGWIDKRTVMDDWHVASWIFTDHLDVSPDIMICMT